MKTYYCSLSPNMCEYGGNKRFNYGFVSGTHEFCRHPKQKTPVYKTLTGVIICPKIRFPEETSQQDKE